jgi:C_GCAxxG_C_C family probable redox protein
MDRAGDAYVLMADGRMNCAQAVLSTYCEEFGLKRDLALKLAQGFGGGMGRTGNTCGAVTAACMVLGLAQISSSSNPRKNMDKTYERVRELYEKFKELHGSVICKELIGYDLSVTEGLAEARNNKVFTTVCPGLVRDSVKILEILLQPG